MEWIKHILKPLMGTFAFLACLLALPEPAQANRHPLDLTDAELKLMDPVDLKSLFHFLITKDVSELPREAIGPISVNKLKPGEQYGRYKIFTQIAGEKFYQTTSYEKVNADLGMSGVINSRSSRDIRASIKILKALTKRTDDEAQEVLKEISNLGDKELFKYAYPIPGHGGVVSDWEKLDIEIKSLKILTAPEDKQADVQAILDGTQLVLEQKKKAFQEAAENLHKLILKNSTGSSPKYTPENFKIRVIAFEWDKTGDAAPEIIEASHELQMALAYYLNSTRQLPDILGIAQSNPETRRTTLYDVIVSKVAIKGHPFFGEFTPLSQADLAHLATKAYVNQEPNRVKKICITNLRNLAETNYD